MRRARDLTGNNFTRFCPRLISVIAIAALIGLAAHLARAQTATGQPAIGQPAPPASALGNIEVLVTPYVWTPWVDVGVNPSNTRIPSASGTVDFGQLADHMSWVPFMGAAEIRDGPFGFMIDDLHAPLRAGISTHNILFSGGTGGLVMDSGTAMFLYRPLAQPDQYVDVGMGVRAWGLAGGITLNQGLLPSFAVTSGVSWADPLIGARYHHDLPNGLGVTAYGDVGGFGLGAHIDWQLMGTMDFKVNSWIDLHAGFRTLNFAYGLPRSDLNIHLNGPILAATFRF